ncbi:MAG: VWA domain-containing protein [Chloroflexi bacterium]|nr:VWA domain-containing protein [Chloroflexota bacterium]
MNLSEIAAEQKASKPKVDIVFVIDTTGSMNDKIAGLVGTLQILADCLGEKSADWTAAVVAFGDLTVPGDTIAATPFTASVPMLKRSLGNLPHNHGGGNEGESSFEALQKAIVLRGFRRDSIKVAVLITDEPALQHTVTSRDVSKSVRSAEMILFVVSPSLNYYRQLAKDNGGEWFQVSATTNLKAILALFDKLSRSVAIAVEKVHLLGGGSVEAYLSLPKGK